MGRSAAAFTRMSHTERSALDIGRLCCINSRPTWVLDSLEGFSERNLLIVHDLLHSLANSSDAVRGICSATRVLDPAKALEWFPPRFLNSLDLSILDTAKPLCVGSRFHSLWV